MKVVLFCGGQGTRIRDYSESTPKPMVPLGNRPIVWHLMKYYAHFGHKDFILALGYQAEKIKDYFIHYDEKYSNNFIYRNGGKDIELLGTDIDDWSITFVDTGPHSNIGMRLMNVREFLGDDDMFLANYADGLTDMHLPSMIDNFKKQTDKVGAFMTSTPQSSMHTVQSNSDGVVTSIEPLAGIHMHLNTGFFIFRKALFDYINYGEELVYEPFRRLIDEQKLIAHHHEGFWHPMDTFKDKLILDTMLDEDRALWKVWNGQPAS